ncbi:MAG TPA: cytochrome c biogenesis protein [Myxococcota bacterium]|nr:cytochrome c biogenesis protein [Myxococcota bacterium]
MKRALMQAGVLDRAAANLRTPSLWALLALSGLYAVAVLTAPEDAVQGVIQKILYVHPACAFAAYLGFGLTALGGALYLWRDDEQYDRLALASAEVGVVFCTLVILTGPIWARGTWGRWWSWDPRLTVTLLLWFVYLAYLLLRSFTEGSTRAARFAAVYGIAGVLAIPLNYFAIDLFGGRAIHPENLGRGSLGAGMGFPFALGMVTVLLAFFHLLARRLELEGLRAHDAFAEPALRSGPARAEGSWPT